MINVIIADGLVDHDYVEKYTVGYDELKERAGQFPPEKVADLTGIPAEDVRKLAREFATTQPSVIRMGVAIERHAGGGNTVRALSCLPALVGSWRHCGGGILHMPIWAFPVNWDAIEPARLDHAGHPGRQPVAAGAGAYRRAAIEDADPLAVRLQLQSNGGGPGAGTD